MLVEVRAAVYALCGERGEQPMPGLAFLGQVVEKQLWPQWGGCVLLLPFGLGCL
jgi:hypothetical protein